MLVCYTHPQIISLVDRPLGLSLKSYYIMLLFIKDKSTHRDGVTNLTIKVY
jgi:hypothetical protein